MSKKSHKALASATVMSLVLTSTLTATGNVQAAAKVERMPGADRFATAQEVAKQSFGKAENVILVNGLGYADAVSATPLAKQLDAPILLTDAEDQPSAKLLATLTDLGAKNIYIIGGTGVVTEAMQSELAKTYKVERIAGDAKDGRYGTNAAVAKKVLEKTKATEAILVSAEGYADALSVASIAATKGMPVLFANKNEVPAVVKDAAKDIKKVMAVGGAGVLPDAVLKAVNAERIAKGADRFETNLTVLKHFDADLKFDNIFVAAGGDDSKSKFADALVASAAAAKFGAPVVLNGLGANETRVKEANKFVKDHMKDSSKVTIVGGEASVSKDIENELSGKKASTGKAEVQSIEAINLNQIKVVFGDKVDEDTAEDVKNYELDGTQLEGKDEDNDIEGTAVADLQDDDRTVIITLASKEGQEKEKTLKVRKGILNAEKSRLVAEKEVKVKFKDTVAPGVKSTSVRGNRKVTVEFTEGVYVEGKEAKDVLEKLAEEIEINGETIDKIGYDTDYSKIKNSIKVDGEDAYYVNKVEFYLEEKLPTGNNKLTIQDGEAGRYLADAAGFTMKEKTIEFKVEDIKSTPKIKSIKGATDGKIYINFDRAMDKKSLKECRITLNNDSDISSKAELKKGDTQIKLSEVSDIKTGSNTIEISDELKDAFGNKIEDELRLSFTASKDDVKPKVSHVLVVDDYTVRVIFSKDVSKEVAKDVDNYTVRDSKGNKVQLENTIKKISADTYDLKVSEKLDGSKYTLKVEDIIDLSGNVMDDYTTTIKGAEVTPIVNSVLKMGRDDKNKERVVVLFDQEMKSSTLNKLSNYKFKDLDGKVREMPSDTKITASKDGKAVRLELPESYEVSTEKIKGKSNSNIVKAIVITKNVESASGIKMDADETHNVEEAIGKSDVKIDAEPMTLTKDGDDTTLVRLKYTGTIDAADNGGFEFADAADKDAKNIIADKATVKGDYIEFRFNNSNDKHADKVRAIGSDLKLAKIGNVTDFAGLKVEKEDVKQNKFNGIYHNEITPELSYNKKSGFVQDWDVNLKKGTITIKFNTRLDEKSANKDDFNFISNKCSTLKVADAKVVKNTIVYTLEKDSAEKLVEKKTTHQITVTPKDDQRIKSKEDLDGDNKKFDSKKISEKFKVEVEVKQADVKSYEGNKVVVKVNKDDLNVAIKTAEAVKADEFTKETAEAMKAKLDAAKKVVADEKADQKAVDAAKDELNAAVKGLVEKVADQVKPADKVNFTVEVKPSPAPGKTIVSVKLAKGLDINKYTMKIAGVDARIANSKFVATVEGSLDVNEAKSKVEITLK